MSVVFEPTLCPQCRSHSGRHNVATLSVCSEPQIEGGLVDCYLPATAAVP
jgi:hypothetical protein